VRIGTQESHTWKHGAIEQPISVIVMLSVQQPVINGQHTEGLQNGLFRPNSVVGGASYRQHGVRRADCRRG
jgi:hypothetical protein